VPSGTWVIRSVEFRSNRVKIGGVLKRP